MPLSAQPGGIPSSTQNSKPWRFSIPLPYLIVLDVLGFIANLISLGSNPANLSPNLKPNYAEYLHGFPSNKTSTLMHALTCRQAHKINLYLSAVRRLIMTPHRVNLSSAILMTNSLLVCIKDSCHLALYA